MSTNFSMTEKMISQYREAFETFDLDKDGNLNLKELGDVMKEVGYPLKENDLDDIIGEVDIDGNGHVDFKEYIQLMARKIRDADTEEELVEAFKLFNKDGDGNIKSEEMVKIMSKLGMLVWGEEISPEEAQEMIDQADEDGDGMLTFEEFAKKIENY